MSDLSAETIAGIRSWLDELAAHKPGFRRRKEQDRAILAIARTLESADDNAQRTIAVEGPTGIGKSIAYVVAGLVAAKRHGKTLVISTATVALQQQLAADLAVIASVTSTPVRTAVLKGRSRYLCDRNLAQLSGEDPDQLGLDLGGDAVGGHWPFRPTAEEREAVQELRAARSRREFDGDLDGWARPIPPRVRPLLTTSAKGCAGASCPYAASCAFLRSRRSVRDADVVVVNHALLLADQRETGGGTLLPPLDESILVVDEAHHLPEVAVEASAATMVLGGHAKRVREAIESSQKAARMRAKAYSTSVLDKLADAERDLSSALDHLGASMASLLDGNASSVPSRRYGRTFGHAAQVRVLPAQLSPLRDELEVASGQAKWLLDQVGREKEKLSKEPPAGVTAGVVSRMVHELGASGDWLQSAHDTLELLAAEDADQESPVARWVSRDGKGTVEVHACPVDASGWLAQAVWRKAFGSVATSATLRAMGDFRHFAERSGLSRVPGVAYVALPSPFDLERSAVLRVPAMVAEPSEEDRFIAEVLIELESTVDPAEGTLILCASRALMEALVERVPASWRDRLRVQGTRAIGPLLESHRAAIAAGEGSILVGLATLAEGVDLPGRQCSHVVIVKLPFMSPTDPVGETRAEWIEARGRSPFAELLLPEAHRRLVQACGRLIRTESDTGRITVLDRRLTTKAYGRRMLDTLPPYRRDIGTIQAGSEARPPADAVGQGRACASSVRR